MAALLLTPRCLGARVLEGSCDRLSSATFVEALGIASEVFRARVVATRTAFLQGQPWVVGPGEGGEVEVPGAEPVPLPALVRDNFLQMRGPTAESNWMVKDRVLTGAHPDYSYNGREVAAGLVRDAHVDTFVCFTEYEPDYVRHGLTTATGRPVR